MSGTISVVLATHNGERFLENLLESLLAQTRLPDEIVISDDDSSDRTLEIVEAFETRSPVPVVRFHNVPGLGFRDNFLQASLKASGNWIAFCDQDDVWRPAKLETCAGYFGEPEVTLVAHRADLIDQSGKPIGRFGQGIRRNAVRPPLCYDPWHTFFGFSMVFRRELLEIVSTQERFVDYIAPKHRIAHDRWIFFLAQILGHTAEISEPLVNYRQHGNNLYGAKSKRVIEGRETVRQKNLPYVEATAAMVRIIEELPPDTEARFPAFDRQDAVSTFRAAHAQVLARDAVYQTGGLRGLGRVMQNLAAGRYRRVEGSGFRWRSVTKDILYCIST